ncbi:MAG: hypothetical protein MJ238_01775 [Bacilli bacterium]|nr:hypothetical protein [Bacilli bacterium]
MNLLSMSIVISFCLSCAGTSTFGVIKFMSPKGLEEHNSYQLDTLSLSDDYPEPYPTMQSIGGRQLITNYLYFKNLTTNFTNNDNDSCTWVAVEIMLSYLNCTSTPDVIPPLYYIKSDVSSSNLSNADSPGTLNVNGSNYTGEYDDSPVCFRKYLLDNYLRGSIEYPILQYFPFWPFIFSRQADLLEIYLEDRGFCDVDDFFVSPCYATVNMQTTFDFIISQLHSGRPVIANTPSHSFIVYGYVPGTHQLVCHYGWHQEGANEYIFDCDSISTSDSAYPGIQLAISVGMNHHSHSYSYIDHSHNEAYCFCGNNIGLTPYEHEHYYVLEAAGTNKKIWRCSICRKPKPISF